MRWFTNALTRASTVCRNVSTRVTELARQTWSKLTYANVRDTIYGAPRALLAGLLFLILSCWRMLCALLLRMRRACTLSNIKASIVGSPKFALGTFLFVLRSVRNVVVAWSRWSKRNWKPLSLLTISLGLLGVGFVRLHDYDVPMLRKDYFKAGQGKTDYNFEDKDDSPQMEIFVKDSFLYRTVTATIHGAGLATDTVVGDRVTAKFNNALSLYQQSRYEEAIKAFNNAYRSMSDKNGQVKRGYEKLAAQAQLMIGNAFCNSGKDSEAINAYQLSLTYDPDNLVTIYNLERLLSNGGGGGKDNGEKPKPSNPNKTKV